ncbi:MAG: CBS domain-containing protein [Candidatus Bathyarchaeota archaeon]|nr:CBS domain-containing protein [Candidatus Bathyarchaeota archaeon]
MPQVKDIMTKDVVTIEANKTVFEAAELMTQKGLGCLVVVIKGFPVGILTERDIVRRIVAKRAPLDQKITEVMTKTVITVEPETSLKEAARVMSTNKIHRLPVLKQNKLVGIVAASDFVRNVGKKTTSEEILEALGRYPASPSV